MNNVYYPPVGIAHVLNGLEDIIKNKASDKKKDYNQYFIST